jgi:hypothetical protein
MLALTLALACLQAQSARAQRHPEDAMAKLLLAMNSAGRTRNVQRALPASMGNQFAGKDKFRARDANIEVWNEIQGNVADSVVTGPKKWQDKFDKWGDKAGEIRSGVIGGLSDINVAFFGAPGDESLVDGRDGRKDGMFWVFDKESGRDQWIYDWQAGWTDRKTSANVILSNVAQGVDEIYVAISPGGKNSNQAQKFKDGAYRPRLPSETTWGWDSLVVASLFRGRSVSDYDGEKLVDGSTEPSGRALSWEERQEKAWEIKEARDKDRGFAVEDNYVMKK